MALDNVVDLLIRSMHKTASGTLATEPFGGVLPGRIGIEQLEGEAYPLRRILDAGEGVGDVRRGRPERLRFVQ